VEGVLRSLYHSKIAGFSASALETNIIFGTFWMIVVSERPDAGKRA
jgi:hypothetical protein